MAAAGSASPSRPLLGLVCVIGLVLGALLPAGHVRAATGDELFISEYVEGSATNKAIEIYNPTDVPVSLGASGYMLAFFLDGSSSIGGGVPLAGTVQAGATWVVTPTNASSALLAKANQKFGTVWFDGNDAVALVHGGAAVDVIGQIGFNPGTAWGTGATTTADHTLRRKASVTTGDPNGSDAFDPAVEWDAFPIDTFDGLGSVGASANQPVTVGCPTGLATTEGIGTTGPVTASDPDGRVTTLAVTSVAPSDPGSITVDGVTPAGAAGATATGTLSVSPATPVGTYSVTVSASNDDVVAQTASCTVAVDVALVTADSLRALIDEMVGDGSIASEKAVLLQRRVDRVGDALAAGRTADAVAQLRALVNQAAGLAPRWLSERAAALIASEAGLLARSQ